MNKLKDWQMNECIEMEKPHIEKLTQYYTRENKKNFSKCGRE